MHAVPYLNAPWSGVVTMANVLVYFKPSLSTTSNPAATIGHQGFHKVSLLHLPQSRYRVFSVGVKVLTTSISLHSIVSADNRLLSPSFQKQKEALHLSPFSPHNLNVLPKTISYKSDMGEDADTPNTHPYFLPRSILPAFRISTETTPQP